MILIEILDMRVFKNVHHLAQNAKKIIVVILNNYHKLYTLLPIP